MPSAARLWHKTEPIYFKNDSGRFDGIGRASIDHLEIAEPPTKTAYAVGEPV